MITLLSDIHGDYGIHENVMRWAQGPTIQLGDCGFNYDYMAKWDPAVHKILGGNHDNYDLLHSLPHNLGDYGTWKGLFFLRGALSVDKDIRKEGVDWWRDEELSYEQGLRALEAYERAKPSIVISHDCPNSASDRLLKQYQQNKNSRTNQLLDAMLEIHQPKRWIFGHWHIAKTFYVPGVITEFQVLNVADKLLIPEGDDE